jgi:hypothetical protein
LGASPFSGFVPSFSSEARVWRESGRPKQREVNSWTPRPKLVQQIKGERTALEVRVALQ